MAALKAAQRLGRTAAGGQGAQDETTRAIAPWMLDDVRLQHGEGVGSPMADDQRLGQVLHRRGSNRGQPPRFAHRPRLVGELLECRPHPSFERSSERHRIAGSQVDLGAGQHGVDGSVEPVPADRRLESPIADRPPQARDGRPQRPWRHIQHAAQPFGPHGPRRVERERRQEAALARAGEVDDLAVDTDQLHRAEHPDGQFAPGHPQSVADHQPLRPLNG